MTIRMRGLGSRGLARMRAVAMVVVAVITVTTLGACVPGAPGNEGDGPRLYTGAIPDPAPLSAYAAGDIPMPVPPEPPADFSDEQAMAEYEAALQAYMDQAQAYQESLASSSGDAAAFAEGVFELVEVTRTSDEASVAAWQSLLVASGIAVGHGEAAVEVSGMTGAGVPMTEGELRLHALLGALEARLPLTQLADMIATYVDAPGEELTQILYDDLNDQGGTAFGMVFMALDPDVFSREVRGRHVARELDEIILTGAQAGLVLRRLSVDLLSFAESLGNVDSVIARTDPRLAGEIVAASTRRVQGADAPCGVQLGKEPWRVELRRDAGKGVGWGFGKTLKWIGDSFDDVKKTVDKLDNTLAALQAGMAIASLLTKLMMLDASFEIDKSPLVRTKDRSAGERGELKVRMSYPDGAIADVTTCLAAVLAPIGIDVSDFEGGGAAGVDLELMIESERVWYSTERGGTKTYRQKADDNGVATFPLLGAAQREKLPGGAAPEEVPVELRLDSNIQGADLWNDLKSAAWDVISPSVAGIIANILARMKLVAFPWEFPLRDWKLTGNFDVTLTGELWSHSGRYSTWSGDCGTFTTHESTTTQGTVDTKERSQVTVEYLTAEADDGLVGGLVMYPRGSDLNSLNVTREGVELMHFPVSYEVSRSMSEPGADPMPPHYQDMTGGSCGDGIGGWVPPQPDCGARSYLGLASLLLQDGAVRVLGNDGDKQWKHCGAGLPFANPLTPPLKMSSCAGAAPTGGEMPPVDTVFGERGWFEMTGTLSCSRDGDGTLDRFTFDWTLKFCRIDEEGKRSQNC